VPQCALLAVYSELTLFLGKYLLVFTSVRFFLGPCYDAWRVIGGGFSRLVVLGAIVVSGCRVISCWLVVVVVVGWFVGFVSSV
jgi:hypothetical protein